MAVPNQVSKVYKTVIDDVITNVKEAFRDEGVDDQVLDELKSLWEKKLALSKAVPEVLVREDRKPVLFHQGASSSQTRQQPPASIRTQALPPLNQNPGPFDAQSSAAAIGQAAAMGSYPQGSTVTIQTNNGPMQFVIQPNVTQQLQQHAQLQHQQQQQLQHLQPSQHQQQPQPMHPHSMSMTIPSTVDRLQLPRNQQLDGANDSSSDDDDDADKDEDDDNDDDDEAKEGEEEEPLNSNDDLSDEDSAEIFDVDNVVVCQFDKINRNKNKWKFHLKDGIMNLKGKDYIFSKSNGEAEW